MKTTLLRVGSFIASTLSVAWVFLLASLFIRARLSEQPFPVLAKFSQFRDHFLAADRMFTAFPLLALSALLFIGLTYYYERNLRTVRAPMVTFGTSVLLSLSVMVLNPGGCVSWLLS